MSFNELLEIDENLPGYKSNMNFQNDVLISFQNRISGTYNGIGGIFDLWCEFQNTNQISDTVFEYQAGQQAHTIHVKCELADDP
jgi:hypothetical protein